MEAAAGAAETRATVCGGVVLMGVASGAERQAVGGRGEQEQLPLSMGVGQRGTMVSGSVARGGHVQLPHAVRAKDHVHVNVGHAWH
jgi:hypothetical protein